MITTKILWIIFLLKYQTFETVTIYNRKIVDRGKIDTSDEQIHDRSLSWLETVTSINKKGGEFKLVLW